MPAHLSPKSIPAIKRPRSLTPELECKRQRKEPTPPRFERTIRLNLWIMRHLQLLDPKYGEKIELHVYQSSRRIASLGEIHLFSRYDPLTGKTQAYWARCQYAVARKVKIECQHREGCNGFSQHKPQSLMGRFLMSCDCPDQVLVNDFVWLVDPKEVEVEWWGKPVKHGQSCKYE